VSFLRRLAPTPALTAGPSRLGRRTKDLIKTLNPGDIAIIDHADLDRIAAEGLIRARVTAVVNATQFITGRYPNSGPQQLLESGVTLIDHVGDEVFSVIKENDLVEIRGDDLYVNDQRVISGKNLTLETVNHEMDEARLNIGVELERFAENTLEYIHRESDLAFAPISLPSLETPIAGRHALVVVRGYDYRSDLRSLRPYIRQYRPVLIGVDGGADALLEAGLRPEIIIGDFDSVSESTLESATDLVHHVHLDGRAPGREQLQEWGVDYQEFVIDGTSEDVAMLLAYEAGATLIVAVGTHATMVEFLDKGRRGMASTFLTRLRLGPMLIDAKGVNRLYEGAPRKRDWLILIGSALVVIGVVIAISQPLQTVLDGFRLTLRDLWFSVFG